MNHFDVLNQVTHYHMVHGWAVEQDHSCQLYDVLQLKIIAMLPIFEFGFIIDLKFMVTETNLMHRLFILICFH
jgi:hypothetical protein